MGVGNYIENYFSVSLNLNNSVSLCEVELK